MYTHTSASPQARISGRTSRSRVCVCVWVSSSLAQFGGEKKSGFALNPTRILLIRINQRAQFGVVRRGCFFLLLRCCLLGQ